MDDVLITKEELKNFFYDLDDEEKDLFFLLLAVGKSGLYTYQYITSTKSERS